MAEPRVVTLMPDMTPSSSIDDIGFAPSPATDRARVLVVDDDERNLLAICTVIDDLAEVVVARSGEEALRHLLKGEFAVILLDVFMPGIDGYETAQLVRAREQTKRIPIVFLSAVNKEAEHLMRGYAMGAVDYVFKPVEPIVLRSKVAVFVDLFTMRQEIERKAVAEQRLLDENLRANAEKLQMEQQLRIAQQRQQAIIDSLPIVLYLEPLDANPREPAFVSGNLEAVTGYSLDAVRSRTGLWAERLHPDDRERVLRAIAGRGQTGAFSTEYRWQCASGEYKYFLDQAVLLKDPSGRPIEFAGTLMDVTDRKLLESQLVHARKMDAVGQLTGGIAHDFNNLLAAVLGGLGMIERRVALDESQQRILGMTRHAAEQGTELVRRLLAFARRQTLAPSAVDVNGLYTAVGELLQHTLGGLVTLEWHADQDLGQLYADASQLELALMNLIINARDAMPDGGTVSVRAVRRDIGSDGAGELGEGRYIALTIADTGHGIPPDQLEQVMEPFFTTKEIGKGTGLGLSMVYGFVRQSGGAITIDSAVGEGTSVELLLPTAPEATIAAAPIVSVVPPPVDHRPLRILLVDDHEGVRTTTAALLEDLGHSIVQATSGPDGLGKLDADPAAFDLVISDYAMPQLSGAEMIEQARRRMPALPGIIITGYADLEAVEKRPEAVLVLAKPFTASQLSAAIVQACLPVA